jgi:hypothetical protein
MEEQQQEPSSTERRRYGYDRRKDGYKNLEVKLDQHATDLEMRFARFMKMALVAFAVIGFMSAGALVGFGFLLKELGDQADDIQNQRRDAVLYTCNNQNRRHRNTIKEFRLIAKQAAKKHPEQAAQIAESVKANIRLIDTLVPVQNCAKLVTIAVDSNK